MRKLAFFAIIFGLLIITACSNDEKSLNKQIKDYTALWSEQKFEELYKLTTKETRDTYDDEAFVQRYQKIYNDLNVHDIDIQIDSDKPKGNEATLPITVKMETIAGSIDFETEITFKKQSSKKKKDAWLVDWNPGLIFPELKNGGEVSIQVTEPKRGEILDRNKMPLAINSKAYEVGIVPEKFSNGDIGRLANILNMSKDSIENKLNASWVQPHLFVPLRKISETDEQTYNDALHVAGVTFKETTGRVYPAKEAAAHLVGYISSVTSEDIENNKDFPYKEGDSIGKRGLEQIYEKDLRGEAGIKVSVIADDGTEEVIINQSVKNGRTLQLTIDVNLQENMFHTYGSDAGTAAIIDPTNGETLALVSSPSFDPNDFLYGISQSQREALENDPKQPLLNRFSSTFAPGSVMKPITAIVGLNNQSIDPHAGLTINGLTWSNGDKWGGYQVRRVSTSSWPVDLADALIRSDNIYFAMQAVKMGHKEFEAGLSKLGFNKEIPYPYPIKQSQISNSGNLEQEVLLANTSYGQGEIELSPIHMAITYTPLFNDGDMLRPQLLLGSEKKVWEEDLINEADIKVVKDALRGVVNHSRGTATALKNNKVAISGKTGTAELKSSKDDTTANQNSWFVGYPTEKEDLLIAIMVEDTKGRGPLTLNKVAQVINDWSE